MGTETHACYVTVFKFCKCHAFPMSEKIQIWKQGCLFEIRRRVYKIFKLRLEVTISVSKLASKLTMKWKCSRQLNQKQNEVHTLFGGFKCCDRNSFSRAASSSLNLLFPASKENRLDLWLLLTTRSLTHKEIFPGYHDSQTTGIS